MHRRRHELRDLLRLGHDPAAALRHRRRVAQVLALPVSLYQLKLSGWPTKPPTVKLLEAAGAVPRALVVGVEDVALGVEADAAGRAHAAGRRDELAVRRHLAGPAAELAVAVERAGQAERDPDVAVLVEARSRRRTRDSRR